MKLYEIDIELDKILNIIYDYAANNEGEITDLLDDQLNTLLYEKNLKVLDIARYYKNLKAESEAIKNEYEKLNKRYRSINNYADRLKNYLSMHLMVGDKYKDSNTMITWRKSESVKILDESIIDEEYFKIIKKPDLTMIKNTIKNGLHIEGAIIQINNKIQIK